MSRVLSGIQPTGRFHWGNYFGAIRQYIELQTAGNAFYFIADLHALTTVREPERLRSFVHDAAVDLLALGLDPAKATLFVQSDVPEVAYTTLKVSPNSFALPVVAMITKSIVFKVFEPSYPPAFNPLTLFDNEA